MEQRCGTGLLSSTFTPLEGPSRLSLLHQLWGVNEDVVLRVCVLGKLPNKIAVRILRK